MIRDPDTLLAIIAQLKAQFSAQIAELFDALAVARVALDHMQAENARLRGEADQQYLDKEPPA